MAHRTVVINVVGLTSSLMGDWSPHLRDFMRRGALHRLRPVLPAVTTSVQSSMVTGLAPGGIRGRGHGIVGNGWYDRELCEVQFWKQSNKLVHGEKVWETARARDPDAQITCANMFWWYNMHSSADYSLTPRPMYKADGRKLPDVYSHPPELRELTQRELGTFPLFQFWGPGASIASSQWIARASMIVHERHDPTLMLIYLPHLDYALQKLGPGHPSIRGEVAAIDAVIGELIAFFRQEDVRIIILSEYGIEPVDDAVPINRILREAGGVAVREEQGLELLDPGASAAFAVADHQVAHVYVSDPRQVARWREICEAASGVEQVLDRQQQSTHGIDHPRGGDLVLIAQPRRWFSYNYWLDDNKAPDFARTVDIHRKPGYDPCELFIDPRIRFPKLTIGWKLLQRRLGMRTLLDVIPLDTSLVRGSHGRVDQPPDHQPVLISERSVNKDNAVAGQIPCQLVRDVILDHLLND